MTAKKTRDRTRYYEKTIPPDLRADFSAARGRSRTHINRYAGRDLAADAAAVKLLKLTWNVEDEGWFAYLRTLPGDQRLVAIHHGSPARVRHHQAALDWRVSAARMQVQTGAESDPLEVAPEMDMSLQDVLEGHRAHKDQLQALAAAADAHRGLAASLVPAQHVGNGMRDLFREWCTAPLVKTGNPPEITHKHKASVERFITVCGDMPVRAITHDHVKAFYAANNAELPDHPAARLKHRDHVKALLALAVRLEWRENNPMDGVPFTAPPRKATDGDDEEGKKPFSPGQLTAILAAAAATWAGKPDLVLALRLLMFCGLRSNETCQLRVTDIEEHAGVKCIRIRNGPGQSVKNKSSRRIVPLHPEVRAEVLARVEAGGEWLFPSFPHHNPKKHNAAFLATFNGRQLDDGTYVGLLRGTCGITDPDLTAHSLRHSFKDACRRARVEGETIKEMMGHGKGCAHEEYGAEMPELMADAIGDVQPLVPGMKPRAVITGRNSGAPLVL